jgi:hypothetical protein
MNDQDLKDLRPYGALLREETDVARLVAGVMDRVRSTPTVTSWLAEWFRPAITALLVMVVLSGAVLYARRDAVPDWTSVAESHFLVEVSNAFR